MKIGISDIGIYIPESYIEIEDIEKNRVDITPRISKRLMGSIKITGQKEIRFPAPWEDTVTMAAESSKVLLERNKDKIPGIRYIGVGTETSVDASKPVAAYLQGLLQRSGVAVPANLGTFQTQHACAAGTIALLNTAAQLVVSNGPNDVGLIVCSDIAHYERNSTAEITQGAGSIALLIEANPRLVEIDLRSQGLSSKDVDDFFRPNHSKTARVKGQYSMKCYQDSLIEAFDDYCLRSGNSIEKVINETDYFICHSPFAAMSKMALRYLYEEKTGKEFDEAEIFINQHGANDISEYISSIGNLYSGSMYLNLATTLYHEWDKSGSGIIGKKILFASYGSGNTMIVFSGTVAPGVVDVVSQWDIPSILQQKKHADFSVYENWVKTPSIEDSGSLSYYIDKIPLNSFYLNTIRSDGYREYDVKK
ncbi:MAG: hypothetical protein PF518_00980 [Spirochaetaceae bacterium]|jgi:hydroxymethylglutaryl-CoA synthase|nr:hypothetical protein [Spirochaetaceae bacterium]